MVTAEQPTTLALTWHSDQPVWVEQWPLTTERLQQAEKLVQEQLWAIHNSLEYAYFHNSQKIREVATPARSKESK